MHRYYGDIIQRIDIDPLWWDDNAVPRFCPFSPREIADIYADECALLLIACQSCGTRFRAAISSSPLARLVTPTGRLYAEPPSLGDHIENGNIGYGDPPNAQCCMAGPTMTSDTLQVLEFWRKPHVPPYDWVRLREYEVYVGESR